MNDNIFTPIVTSQACDQCPTVPLAPRPSAKLLPPEALSLGPYFPRLDLPAAPPCLPQELPMSEGDQGDGSNCYRGLSRRCIRKSHEQRGRTLTPPTIIRLRPRFSGYTPGRKTNVSSAVSRNTTGFVSLSTLEEEEPSRKRQVMENPAVNVEDDHIQLMQRSCLLDGQENRSSFPRAA